MFDPAHQIVCQNMDQPFNHYFIATSYNTYLVEDQVLYLFLLVFNFLQFKIFF